MGFFNGTRIGKGMKGYRGVCAVFVFVFSFFCLMNFLNPLSWGDDLLYAYVWEPGVSFHRQAYLDGVRVDGWASLFESVRLHYLWWHGRLTAVFLNFWFMWAGKPVFNVLNTLAFLYLGVVVYWCGDGGRISFPSRWKALVFIYLSFWWFFGTMPLLWLSGSCNYLWTACVLLSFLRFYVKDCMDDTGDAYTGYGYGRQTLLFVLGVLAGATNENTVPAVALFILSMSFVRGRRMSDALVPGFVGLLCGYAVLLFSPGIGHRLFWEFDMFSQDTVNLYDTEKAVDNILSRKKDYAFIAQEIRKGNFWAYLPFQIPGNFMRFVETVVRYSLLVVLDVLGVFLDGNRRRKGTHMSLLAVGFLSVFVLTFSPYVMNASSLFFLCILLAVLTGVRDVLVGGKDQRMALHIENFMCVMLFLVFAVTACFSVRKAYADKMDYDRFERFVTANRGKHIVMYVPRTDEKVKYLTCRYVMPFYSYLDYKDGNWTYQSAVRYYGIGRLTVYRHPEHDGMLLFVY